MAILEDVKCARCDHTYSALRGRCPYCGTPRRVQSKRAADSDNNKIKLFIGLLLLAVVVVAVVLVLAHSLGEDKGGTGGATAAGSGNSSASSGTSSGTSSGSKNNDGVTVLPGNNSGTSSGTSSGASSGASSGGHEDPPPVEDKVTSIQILTPWGSALAPVDDPSADYDYDITMTITETLLLSYKVTPENVEFPYSWESSDTTKVIVLQTGKLTPVGSGNCYVTLTVGDVKKVIIVRVTGG